MVRVVVVLVVEETGIAAYGVMIVEKKIRVVRPCSEQGMRIAVDDYVSFAMAVLNRLVHVFLFPWSFSFSRRHTGCRWRIRNALVFQPRGHRRLVHRCSLI